MLVLEDSFNFYFTDSLIISHNITAIIKELILYWTGVVAWKSKTFNSQDWPRQNFLLQHQYKIKETSDENEEKYHLEDYKLI